MELINIDKIKGKWIKYQNVNIDGATTVSLPSGGDDTIESIKLVAQKVNEIVEFINDKKDQLL